MTARVPTTVLLSIEPWDAIWRRNQQLGSRLPAAIFVEPPRPGLRHRLRVEAGVTVATPPKPLPHRARFGRELAAALTARLVRKALGGPNELTWATHPYHLAVCDALGAPVVYDRTDDWPAMESDPGARAEVARLEAELLKRAAKVVVVSESMRAQTRDDAVLLPNGVDHTAFARVGSRTLRGGRLRIAFAGTLDPFRVDFEILTALAHHPDVELVLAGPGTPPPGLTSLGSIPHQQLPAIFKGCDALVAPYRLDQPANDTSDSLKLYEYFATGLPVIATSIAGFERHPELVIPYPVDDLRAACSRQAAGAAKRRKIAAAADWALRAATMRALFAELAA